MQVHDSRVIVLGFPGVVDSSKIAGCNIIKHEEDGEGLEWSAHTTNIHTHTQQHGARRATFEINLA